MAGIFSILRRTTTLGLLGALAALPAHASVAGESSNCSSFDANKCSVKLSTGIRMAYVEIGPKDGTPVILLHGLTDSARSWAATMSALHAADPSLHIFAVDQRGHGETTLPSMRECAADPKRCFAPALFADDLVSFIQEKRLGRVFIAGHSMGSIVAQEVALDYPARVRAIVLVATTSKPKGNPVIGDFVLRQTLQDTWLKTLKAKKFDSEAIWNATPIDADPNAEEWLAKNWDVDPIAPQALVQAMAKSASNVKLGTWIGASEAFYDFDNTARLPNLKVPTLVLWGVQDPIFRHDPDQEGIIAALGKAAAAHKTPVYWKQYGAIPLPASGEQTGDIGHNIEWEAPKQVADDLLSFFKKGKPTTEFTKVSSDSGSQAVRSEPVGATILKLTQ